VGEARWIRTGGGKEEEGKVSRGEEKRKRVMEQ